MIRWFPASTSTRCDCTSFLCPTEIDMAVLCFESS